MIRNSITIMVLCALVLFILPACGGSDNGVLVMRPVGTILGRVVDTVTDTPLSNAVVTITSAPLPTDTTGSGQVVIVTGTDASGTFNRNDIPNGQITVKVKRTGYRTPEAQIWALTPGGSGEFYFEMAPGEDPLPDDGSDDQRARPPDSKWDEM